MNWHGRTRRGMQGCGMLLGLMFMSALVQPGALAAAVTLAWTDNADNEIGFKIERSSATGAFAPLATIAANSTSYLDTSAASGAIYNYRVYAYNVVGDSAYSNTVAVTVPLAANQAPTISNLADRTITPGTGTGAIAFTVGDAETSAASLLVSGTSSNAAIVANAGIVVAGSGANRTVTVTPLATVTGSATITITVSDGDLSASDTFVLTVSGTLPGNSAPTISALGNQTILAGTTTGALSFSIGDAETAAGGLTVTAQSSNPTLVPAGGILLSGTGGSRAITVTPAAGTSGAATITVRVSDGELATDESFTVTVNAAQNSAPTISNIFSRTITEDSSTGAINFTIGDDETAAGSLAVSGSSSNPALVGNSNIVFGGSGSVRTVSVTPFADASGETTITITVSDGTAIDTDTFRVTVSAVNDAPVISSIGNQSVSAGGATPVLGFTIDDVESAPGSLNVSASSSNATLVPASGIVLGGSGANRTIVVTPAGDASGTATITLTVSDGSASSSELFSVTVTGSDDAAPAVSSVSNQTSGAGGQVGPLPFSIADDATAAASLVVTGSSSNPSLVPAANIVFGGSGAARTVSVFAANGQSGVATITLTVSDGVNTSTESFLVAFGAPLPANSRMLNLSSRVVYRPGGDNLIPGFVISGTANKRVLLRVVGPTLGQEPFNIPGVLPDPRMTLKRWDGAAFVDYASNDNWGTSANVNEIRQVTREVSAFDLVEGGHDAVLLENLPPGRYTIVADDASAASGLVIVEIYDAEAESEGSSLVNMSNRGHVGVGGEAMITGFVVANEGAKTLLIRAIGPGLAVAPYLVPNTIPDPIMEIYRRNPDGSDTLVLTQDNWSESPDAAETALIAEQAMAFALPAGSNDAAVVATMEPGIYTVVVHGVDNATGTALVEVYTIE